MRFEILGPLRVRTESGELAIAASRERAVLTVLLLHANHTVPTSQLVETIWQDHPPQDARGQLQGCVYRLRKQLTGAGAGPIIHTDPVGYRAVVVEPDQLDLLEFRRLVAQARTAAADGRPDLAIEHYRAGSDLWRGRALAGTDTGSVQYAAVPLDEERTQALEERLDLELAAGLAGRLVPELTDLVQQHPHREGLHRALMKALYGSGRQADALAAYRHARQILHDDLGTEPAPELQRLHQAILTRDPALDFPLTSTVSRPAGERSPIPRELPADVAGFTGRSDPLRALDELLPVETAGAPAPLGISMITGTAGVGKTALAVHWARRVADRFPDGQLYLNLHGHASGAPLLPAEALPALLRSLGTPPEQIPTDEAEAAARYRSQLAGRRVLVVLDNAGAADQVRPLLPGAPGCLVLITSRNRLTGLVAREGARAVGLDVLTPGEAQLLLARLLGSERVGRDPEATAALPKVCGFLPLALRIAAASLAEHPRRGIASYVSDLTAGDRLTALQADGDEESAVRGAFDLSYRAIPAEARRLFRWLGLVPGPDVTPPVAAVLTSTTVREATKSLARLASNHLIVEHAAGRYTFHDLLRLYAIQLAEAEDSPDERAAAVERLLDSYLSTTDAAAVQLHPQMLRLPLPPSAGSALAELAQPATALAWLDAERANLVAAVLLTAKDRHRPPAWLLADRLRGYFWHGRHTTDWLAAASAALNAAERGGDAQSRAAAHFSLAHLHQCSARYQDAISHYTAAVDLARQADWTHCQAATLTNLGLAYQDIGQLEESADQHTRALALNRDRGDLGWQAVNLVNLGFANRALGRLRQATGNLGQALEMNRALGYRHGEAAAAGSLGVTYHDLGQLADAHKQLACALSLYRETGDRAGEAVTLHGLAAVHDDAGRRDDANDTALRAVALATEIGDGRCEADALNVLGRVRLHVDRASLALGHHLDALDLARQAKVRYPETAALVGLAAARYLMGELEQASEMADHAITIAREVGYRVLEGQATTLLAEILFSQREHGRARECATRALDIHRQTGHRIGEARTLVVLGHVQHATEDPAAAAPAWQAAYDLFTEVGAPVPDDLARQLKGD